MRGIIVMPRVSVTLPDEVKFGGSLDMQLLRVWLLYWDEIVYAEASGLFAMEFGVEYEYLSERGVFRKHEIEVSGTFAQSLVYAREQTFRELEGLAPGGWALASGPGAWEGPESDIGRGLQVKLINALPVPDQDVPLDEILSFRDKRKEQRESLMFHINETYQSVLAAPDRPLAEHDALKRLARSAREQVDVVRDAGFPFRLSDLAADFNVIGAAAAVLGNLPFSTWPVLVGNSLLAGASVTISQIAGMFVQKNIEAPFRYVVSYHSEVFRN